MAPITPLLSKSISQQPIAGTNAPTQIPSLGSAATPDQPISAFQWVSLARATWTWLLKPLWYLCVKWPVQILLPVASKRRDEEWQRREDEWWDDRQSQERRQS